MFFFVIRVLKKILFSIKIYNFNKEWGKKRKKNLRKYIDGMH